ncbi:MAG: hypothetical protein ISS66_09430 [Desulfobacteraceae bacterium]|nr:hypothetical protein [Desulfobacteraceae bacterium]
MSIKSKVEKALEQGHGILRLAPTWVPRAFCVPGRRIKLHPDDYYTLGLERGGIDERWLSSTTQAENGPGTPEDEGLSYIVFQDNGQAEKILLREAIDSLKGEIIGEGLWQRYQKWPMYSKFFDNQGPLPHHIHHRDIHAEKVGQMGKPEVYYFPKQLNNHGGEFPFTFFGLTPETTKEEVKECLKNFTKGDNKLINLSRCYKLEIGTGWDVPPGVLHAPGSLCTYEPQIASDVFAMYQSVLSGGQTVPEELLWKDTPEDKIGDFSYLIEIIDWDLNVDPDFHHNRFMRPVPVLNVDEMRGEGYVENWICYKTEAICAKELTILPGRSVTIRDNASCGIIVLQGHGKMGLWNIETPTLIRYGQLTNDEFFITEKAAREGIPITNPSDSDPIVMLKHFGPNNPDLPETIGL